MPIIKKPQLVTNPSLVHKKNSIRVLLFTVALNLAAGLWAALPDSWINQLPPSMIFSVSTLIAMLGVAAGYIRQEKLAQAVRDLSIDDQHDLFKEADNGEAQP